MCRVSMLLDLSRYEYGYTKYFQWAPQRQPIWQFSKIVICIVILEFINQKWENMHPPTSIEVPKEDDNKKQSFLDAFLSKYAMFAFLFTWPSDHGPIQEYSKCTEKTGFYRNYFERKR